MPRQAAPKLQPTIAKRKSRPPVEPIISIQESENIEPALAATSTIEPPIEPASHPMQLQAAVETDHRHSQLQNLRQRLHQSLEETLPILHQRGYEMIMEIIPPFRAGCRCVSCGPCLRIGFAYPGRHPWSEGLLTSFHADYRETDVFWMPRGTALARMRLDAEEATHRVNNLAKKALKKIGA